ncbi:MAG: hypothetical protein GX878_03170, partial [Firmicutes bacterium]|nr:hypothetical protein [Bacillota bacterium]
ANQVYVLFVFDADVSVAYSGWYIDRVSVVEIAQTTRYYSDFEGGNGGFIALAKTGYQNSWEWGIPTHGPGLAYSGMQVWATRLGNNYYNNSHCFIRGPVVNLDSDGGNFFSFYHWYDLEYSYDRGWAVFFVSETEYYYYPDYYYTGVNDCWGSDTYPLDWLFDEGYSQFRPGFLFKSDYSVTKPGWYIDDVHVYTIGCGISAATAGMTPVKMTINERPECTKESDPEKDKNAGKREKTIANFCGLSLPVNFRQPLQGPEPAVQPNCESALPLLPVAATITVLETGTDTTTDPANGFYQLWHQATGPDEILTLRVIAPGYQAQEVQFNLAVMETKVLDFILEPLFEITGDLNDDGNVDVSDAIILLRSIVGLVTLTSRQATAADVNNDGKVDVSDAIAILRYIVGLVPELPIPPASA